MEVNDHLRWHCQWNPTIYGQWFFKETLSVESHQIWRSWIIWGDIVSGIPPDMEVNDNLGDIVSGIPSDTEVKDDLRWHYQWKPTIYGGQWSFEETLSVESHQIWKSRTIWGDIVSGISPDMEIKDHLKRHCQWNPTRYGGQGSFRWHCQWNLTTYGGQGSFRWHCQRNLTTYGGQGSFEETQSVESHQKWRSWVIWDDIVSGIPPDMEVKHHLRRHCRWNPTRDGGQGSFEGTLSVESHHIWRSVII